MANLSIKELTKPGREFRTVKIIEKLKTKSPFELDNGSKVVLQYSKDIETILLDRKKLALLKNIEFYTTRNEKIPLTKIKKNQEFGGAGGAGLGAKGTAIAESLHALFAQSLYDSNSLSPNSLENAAKVIDVTSTLKEMLEMPEDWLQSAESSAKLIVKYFKTGNKVVFHRGSKWVKNLEAVFNRLNKQHDNLFSDINKWSPADIYMVSSNGNKIDLNKAQNLVQLNEIMNDALKKKDIVGISLKKVVGPGTLNFYNTGEKKKKIEYKSYTVGKTGFFNSKDTFIFFEVDGQLQMRTFPSFQGEIKGKNASQGKIGYGGIASIIRTKLNETAPDISSVKLKIKRKDDRFLKEFYEMYVELSNDQNKVDYNGFITKIYSLNEEWILSKYLGSSIINILLKTKVENGKNIFVSGLVDYASSTTDLSGPFAKIQ